MRKGLWISLLTVLAGPPVSASSSTVEALKLAGAYGLEQWETVDQIRFTYHLDKGPVQIKRVWDWEPRTGKVTVETIDEGQPYADSYVQSELVEQPEARHEKTEKWFAEDKQWLIFPLQVVLDEVMLNFEGDQPLPIGQGRAKKVTVSYTPAGASTPGDAYDLYYGPAGTWADSFTKPPKEETKNFYKSPYVIQQWSIRKGGSEKPQLTTTWDKYVQLGPLIIATEHRSGDGKYRQRFSDLSIRLVGHADWMQAKPLPR